jgi:phosphoribosylformimino-5-aminoimidazole carboxamide ribotide isomerase
MVTSDFEILPAIDLRGGRVVRLVQGDFAQETTFSDDPVAVARGFADAGARWLHVVDLDGARDGIPGHGPVIGAIVRAVGERLSVEVAGGIRDASAAANAIRAGAARIVVGTAAIRDPSFAARLVDRYGPQRVAIAIDVRAGKAVGHGWALDAPGADASATVATLAALGVDLFEVTAIDRDGLLGGPDLDLYERLVAQRAGTIIASGGITQVDDLHALRDLGCGAAIIGRALYEGRIALADALALTGTDLNR